MSATCALCGTNAAEDYEGEREKVRYAIKTSGISASTTLAKMLRDGNVKPEDGKTGSVRVSCLRHYYLSQLDDTRQLRWPGGDSFIPNDVKEGLQQFSKWLESADPLAREKAATRGGELRHARMLKRASSSIKARATDSKERLELLSKTGANAEGLERALLRRARILKRASSSIEARSKARLKLLSKTGANAEGLERALRHMDSRAGQKNPARTTPGADPLAVAFVKMASATARALP